jgi:protein-S-isoprenylcysteine O-methyltransferase Ste14
MLANLDWGAPMKIVWGIRHHDPIAMTVFWLVIATWITFAGVFMAPKKPPQQEETKRDKRATLGIVLQGIGYAVVWAIRRPLFSPVVSMPVAIEIVLAIITVGIAALSVWLVMTAVRTLGKQWAYAARLIEGHKLVTEGPYRWVRNPIYTGMLGMLLATGLAVSHWVGLLPAIIVFVIGTMIRVRTEEKLLHEAFGQEFENYAQRVPAVLPGIY